MIRAYFWDERRLCAAILPAKGSMNISNYTARCLEVLLTAMSKPAKSPKKSEAKQKFRIDKTKYSFLVELAEKYYDEIECTSREEGADKKKKKAYTKMAKDFSEKYDIKPALKGKTVCISV